MNFPIPVDMTVQGDVTVSCVVDLRISPNVHETYDGPYSVTPSESVQTLETGEKLMADNVSVGAIPSDYVGSAIPWRSSGDILITKRHVAGLPDHPTAIAMSGYYRNTAMKDIPTGTATTPDTSLTATPSLWFSPSGLVVAIVSTSQSVAPVVSEGYVMSGTAGTVSVQGRGTLQLDTQAAQTITPTTTDQTIDSGKFLTGAQTIKGDANLLPENIKKGVTIFGVVGTYDGG